MAPRTRLAVVVERYPALSESFVRRDLARLEAEGFDVAVVACTVAARGDAWLDDGAMRVFRPGRSTFDADAILRVREARCFFPPGARRLARAARTAWTAAALQPRLAAWQPDWVHAHFLGMPAAVAALLAAWLDVPLSISAHARDIFVPAVDAAALCARARFISVCSEHAEASLLGRLPPSLADRVVRFPHDVDCAPDYVARRPAPGAPLRLLSVCRLVPKKGIDTVLRALALLPRELDVHYRIVGTGAELSRLRALTRQLELPSVEFVGALAPAGALRELEHADLFVLGTRMAADGDRDGIPNAILEAMAAGVPVIAGDAGAVCEVIRHRETGWLVAPNDPRAMANALLEAASNALLRCRIAAAAHAEVLTRFSRAGAVRRSPLRLLRDL